ncbi:helix-turn-helix domain-containing protein [Streptomyces albidus (ex Kaewkla and Franco 2022)]|uniref:helix-turn-helix domain-containing protein n=1 Tax=Streptomyces albidus (ex Kaewkla and Franco 2022) TaxID=722709 RepID=UPI001F349125|nr:helix-turn-helix domain-containing protein [Streptomyces albidus (ex Kaewkla and Franco 2022)]
MSKKSELPTLYTADHVAEALDCSTWWVKEQARRGRIPFIRSGSGYRFTKGHVEEIFELLEERPSAAPTEVTSSGRRGRTSVSTGAPVAQLRARRPRRTRNAA